MRFQERYLRYALYVLAVILLNVAAATLFFRLDLTTNRVYSLSDTSKEAVASLKEPLTIKAYFSRNLPAPYNNLETEVRDLLGEYASVGNHFFNYDVVSVDTEDSLSPATKEAQDYGIRPIQIQKVEQDQVNLVNAYMGLVLIHGERLETLNSLGTGDNLEFQLTSLIRDMTDTVSALLSLDGDISVELYLSPSLQQVYPDLTSYADKIQSAVEQQNVELYDRLDFQRMDIASKNPTDSYGISALVLRNQDGSEEDAFADVVVTRDGQSVPIRLLRRGFLGSFTLIDPTDLGDRVKSAALRLAGVNPTIAYLTSNGTEPLDPSQTPSQGQDPTESNANFLAALQDRYTLLPADLTKGPLPEGPKTLLIVGPADTFSDWELYQIDQFLMAGNSLAFFMDTHTEVQANQSNSMFGAPPTYVPRNTGLEKLLAHYGMGVRKSYVFDENAFKQQSRNANGGIDEYLIYTAPEIPSDKINHSLPGMRSIKNLIGLNLSPVETLPTEEGQAQPQVVFSSSDTAWEQTENFNLAMPILNTPPPNGARDSYPLAYYAEGTFTSYFKDRPAPKPPAFDDAQVYEPVDPIPSTDQGKIFLIGSSAMLSDALFDREAQTSNATLVLNMIDILNDQPDFAVMRGKGQSFNPLQDSSSAARSLAKTTGIFVLPVLVILVGVLTWFSWRRRQRTIQAAFEAEVKS